MANPVYCALDTGDLDTALDIADKIAVTGCGMKLGMEFFNAQGPQGIAAVRKAYPDLPLFIDLKYHDIPNTVAGAIRSIVHLAPDYLNVHASGGKAMMISGRDAMKQEAERLNIKCPKLLAVTVLTSIDENELSNVGQTGPIADQVKRLARLTQDAGLDGVVCSPLEIELVRKACGPDFITMVPGIRPQAANDDQKRVMTPKQAMDAGATHMVIGRPITQAPDPAQAVNDILQSL